MTTIEAGPVADHGAASAAARRAMIDSQLRTSGVTDPLVLAAMAATPREDFVPAEARGAAYSDRAIPLGGAGYLAAPLFYGRMLAEAEPSLVDRALVVSGGSGYLAALVRPLVGELQEVSAAEAKALSQTGPFSLILVDGAIEETPRAWAEALGDDGRIVGGVVERGVTRLAVGRKAAGAIAWLPLAEIGIPVLPEFAAPRRWSF